MDKYRFLNFVRGVDGTFLGLVVFTAVVDLPFFLNIVVPIHDTMHIFQDFYFFYNEFYWHSEIARWLPFGFFGMHSDYFFIGLTPIHYLVGFIGWAFRIENVFLLFKVATFIEHLVLLFGTYLLAMTLFKRRAVAALVCLAVIGSTAMMVQISWNFHIYYLLPLFIYFLVRFFETFKPQYLVITMIMYTFSTFGGAYMSMVNLLAMTTFSLVLLLGNIKNWRRIFSVTKKDVAVSGFLFIVFLVYASSFYYFAKNAMGYTEIFSIGRDPATGLTDLRTFLTYGGDIGSGKFPDLLSPKNRLVSFSWGITAYDLSLYVGLISLAFALCGVIQFRNVAYLALVAVVAALGFLSQGGKVAEFLYNYFPLMKYFRHIGYSVSGYKVLLPLLAGYGFKRCLDWAATPDERLNTRRTLIVEAVVAGVVLVSGITHFRALRATLHPQYYNAAIIYGVAVAALVATLFFVRRYFRAGRHLVLFIVVSMLAEILIYQAELTHGVKIHSERVRPVREEAVSVNEYGYQKARSLAMVPGRAVAAVPLVWGATPYNFAYNFLQWDPCIIQARTDNLNSLVALLIKARGGNFNTMQVHMPDDSFLLNSLGCTDQKLRLVTKPVYTGNLNETVNLMVSNKNLNNIVVLNDVPPGERLDINAPGEGGGAIEVKNFKANALDLEVEAPSGGAWLYYADAWHPYWKASVNGKDANIAIANVAFKAVRLDGGRNKVRFYIDAGLSAIYLKVIVVIGLLIAFILVSAITLAVFKPGLLHGDSYSPGGKKSA